MEFNRGAQSFKIDLQHELTLPGDRTASQNVKGKLSGILLLEIYSFSGAFAHALPDDRTLQQNVNERLDGNLLPEGIRSLIALVCMPSPNEQRIRGVQRKEE